MHDKRGISAIVATVMIIMITVAAVGIVWTAIIPLIQTSLDFSALEGRVTILTSRGYTAYDPNNKIAMVQVKRDTDEGVMNNIKISFDIGGNSYSNTVVAPSSGGTKVYYFYMGEFGKPDSVSAAPIFAVGNREKEGSVTSNVDLSESSIGEAANINLKIPKESLINSESWEIGSGSVAGYSANGAASENIREMGIGPHGEEVLLWKAVPDSVSDADGGWHGATILIDHTKTYRSTIWIKKTGSTGGTTYFGCIQGSNDGNTNNDPTLTLAGVGNWNPYFWNGDLPELDKWYLLVGYIHGSGDPSTTHYGGIYDGETGEKVISIIDYKNRPGITTQVHRTYLYYDTTTTDRQYFWNPTFTDVTGLDLPIEVVI